MSANGFVSSFATSSDDSWRASATDLLPRTTRTISPVLTTGSRASGPLHRGQIPPERLQALRPSKQGREDGGVGKEDAAGSFVARRHPEQGIELPVSLLDEGVRPVHVDRLARENVNRRSARSGHLQVRQVRMEIERRDA